MADLQPQLTLLYGTFCDNISRIIGPVICYTLLGCHLRAEELQWYFAKIKLMSYYFQLIFFKYKVTQHVDNVSTFTTQTQQDACEERFCIRMLYLMLSKSQTHHFILYHYLLTNSVQENVEKCLSFLDVGQLIVVR